MLIYKSMQISSAKWEPTIGQVLTSQLDCPTIVENCINVVTDRLLFVLPDRHFIVECFEEVFRDVLFFVTTGELKLKS